jgi:anti-sigma factor RsiW
MNCKKARQWISRDLDGELDARRKAGLAVHLEGCPACRGIRESWGRVGIRLREAPAVPAQTPEAAWADVRRSIRKASDRASAPGLWVPVPAMRWAVVAAVVLVMGLFALRVLPWRGPARSAERLPAEGTKVEMVETDLPGAAPMVYEDAGTGLTVIWVVEGDNKEGGHAGS